MKVLTSTKISAQSTPITVLVLTDLTTPRLLVAACLCLLPVRSTCSSLVVPSLTGRVNTNVGERKITLSFT